MLGFIKPILAEVSTAGLADGLKELIKKCAECETLKGIAAITGVATAAQLLIPAAALVGMELFKRKGERKEEEPFQQHCKDVIALLDDLDGRVDTVAEQLDGLIERRKWVWARFSGADQAAFAKRVRTEIKKDLTALGVDIRDDLQGLRIYSETIIVKEDQIIATQAEHSAAQVDQSAAIARIEKLLLAQQQSNPSPPTLSADDQRILDEAKQSNDIRTRLAAKVLQPDDETDELLAQLRRQQEANEFELCMLEGKRWFFARPIPQFDQAIPLFERAMQLRPDSVETLNYAASAHHSARLGDIAAHQERAIAINEATLTLVPSNSSDWASTQSNLGNAWRDLPTGERAKNLETAIACFTQALDVPASGDFPVLRALTLNNLGTVLAQLKSGEESKNVADAIACFTQALQTLTRDDFPDHWAVTQSNLGAAWRRLRAGDRANNVKNAIDCFMGALAVHTRSDFPVDWAQTQCNLGTAWMTLPTGDQEKNLEKAVDCYTLALEVLTRADFPAAWALTQNNLGLALATLVDETDLQAGQDRCDLLRRAIASTKGALNVYMPDVFPLEHAEALDTLSIHHEAYNIGGCAEKVPFNDIPPAE